MACEGNYNKIPININKSDIRKLSKNLSHFTYDFNNISKLTIKERILQKHKIKGGFMIKTAIKKAVAHIPTMGKLDFYGAFFFMKSINKYGGKNVDMEIILYFENKDYKPLYVFIPIKKENTSSKSAKWFSQFTGFIVPNSEGIYQEISVNNFNFNDIIPQDSFISYKASIPYMDNDCSKQNDMIFFEKSLNIKNDDYDALVKSFEMNDYANLKNLTELTNVKNFEIKNISLSNAFFDYRGTKNGPGLKSSNETLPLICSLVEESNGDPLGGSRLDWIKGSFDSIGVETKNLFYLIIIVGILTSSMIFFHATVFKNIGKFLNVEEVKTAS